MKGIELLRAIRLFGFKDGFSFWFNWSLLYPMQEFLWLNITHKPYCLECGWHCNEGKCNGRKLTNKQDILNRWKEQKKEVDTIEKGKNDMCAYCGDEKGTEIIPNPNFDKLSQWLVCKVCKDVLKYQIQYTMSQHFGAEELASEAINKLDEIAKRTGKPIMVAGIRKTKEGYKTSSIEFKGEE